jgi:hypothetical protein
MRPSTRKIYEWYLVVEGSGEFPIDMLRYDSAFPAEERDSSAIQKDGRRRVVLLRRGVGASEGSHARWRSFGWPIVFYATNLDDARIAADAPITTGAR